MYNQSELEMAALLKKSLYVDDLLSGAESDEKTLEIYHKLKKIMASRGFNLRKWNLNSQTLLKSIETCESLQEQRGLVDHATAEDDESYAKLSITPRNSKKKNDTVVKVLGMNWDIAEDNFFFDFTDLCDYGMSLQVTEHSVFKLEAMVFLALCTVEMKILFQELCLNKIDWNSNLPENLHGTWNS